MRSVLTIPAAFALCVSVSACEDAPATAKTAVSVLPVNSAQTPRGDEIVIPVVFHVYPSGSAGWMSEASIHELLGRINENFAGDNDCNPVLPPAFAAVRSGSKIRFALAAQDPEGYATNGIITYPAPPKDEDEVANNDWTYYIDNVKVHNYVNFIVSEFQIWNGSSAIAKKDFYTNNILININDVTLKHKSYLPYGVTANEYLAAVVTHELGHFFDLGHLWADVDASNPLNDPPFNKDCEGEFDGIEDTPPQKGPTGHYTDLPLTYPFTGNACPETDSNGVMFANYMDAVYDQALSCMFTAQQVARMENYLQTNWTSLINSPGLKDGKCREDAFDKDIASNQDATEPSIGWGDALGSTLNGFADVEGTLCEGDEDWYVFSALALPVDLSVWLDSPFANDDYEFEVYRYTNPGGYQGDSITTELVDSGASTNYNFRQLLLATDGVSDYAIRVYGKNNAFNLIKPYYIALNEYPECDSSDSYEPNDYQGDETNLNFNQGKASTSANLCTGGPFDNDLYALPLSGATDSVRVTVGSIHPNNYSLLIECHVKPDAQDPTLESISYSGEAKGYTTVAIVNDIDLSNYACVANVIGSPDEGFTYHVELEVGSYFNP